jgi:hypothetical protein
VIWLVVSAHVATVVWVVACLKLGVLREWHHFWLGLPLALMGYWPVMLLGNVIMWDDAIQHAVQCWRPAYRSPLHRAAHRLGLI